MITAPTTARIAPTAAALTATLGLAAASGLRCMGSYIGLMLMQVVLGVMSVTWTSLTAVLVLRDRLRMVVAARCGMIQARDVDPREPRPDGRHCPQDQAVSD
jgi:hypothetical protein